MKRGVLLPLAVLATAFAIQHTAQPARAVGEGVFQLDATEYSVNEGSAVQVTVQRTQGGTLTADVAVILEVNGETDTDIPTSELFKTITFPAGSNLSSKSVFVQTLNKERFNDRTIQVTILSVSNGGVVPLGGRTTAPITLLGSGTPRVFSVSPDSGSGYEAPDFTIVTVTGENFVVSGPTFNSTLLDVQFCPILGGPCQTVPLIDVLDITPTSMRVKVPTIDGPLSDFAAPVNQINQPAATYHVVVHVNPFPDQVPDEAFSPMTVKDHYVATTGPSVRFLSVHQGPPTGGTSVVVSGVNFPTGPVNTSCMQAPPQIVQFGGLDVTACKYGAPGQLIVTTPAHISGVVDVIVNNGGVKSPATPSSKYNYQGVPIINSLSPNFGPQAGGNQVLISGSGFFIGSFQPSAVLFGGNAATFTMISDTQILATVPPGSGVQQVKIIHPVSGTSDFRTEANYTYSPGPIINALSPSHGAAVGGTVVTISGAGFAPGAVVKFGEIQAFATVVNENTITATAPAGSGIVTVTVAVNTTISPPGPQAQYSYDGPTVTSVAPIAGPIAGGTSIVIRGTNFTTASTVKIGNSADLVPTFVDPTTLTIVTPPLTPAGPGSVAAHVRVTTGSGQSPEVPEDVFTYTNGPIVDGVNPENGPTTGGTIVIITGKNFSAPLSVSFGGVPATSFNVNSATQITVLSPPNPVAGPADVRVTKGSDVSPIGPKTKFTYLTATPKVTQLTPNTGSTFGGTEITITGIGLSGAVCPGSVKFGSVPASTCTVVNDSTITTTAPPNISGITVVTITTANGTSDIVPNYTYVSPNAPGGGTAPPAPGPGGTTTYTLHTRWTLLTWTGGTGVNVSDAVRGTGVLGASDLSSRISAIYLWDAATSTWKAYFTGAEGIPGASDFSTFTPGAVYWVAILGTGQVPWVVIVPP